MYLSMVKISTWPLLRSEAPLPSLTFIFKNRQKRDAGCNLSHDGLYFFVYLLCRLGCGGGRRRCPKKPRCKVSIIHPTGDVKIPHGL